MRAIRLAESMCLRRRPHWPSFSAADERTTERAETEAGPRQQRSRRRRSRSGPTTTRGVATAVQRVSARGPRPARRSRPATMNPTKRPAGRDATAGPASLGSSSGRRRRRSIGDEQRGDRAAVAKDDVAEPAALIDTGMPLEHLQRSVDRWRHERRERGVRRTIAARRLFERDRSLGEIEFDGAVLVIAGRLTRQHRQARSRARVAHEHPPPAARTRPAASAHHDCSTERLEISG